MESPTVDGPARPDEARPRGRVRLLVVGADPEYRVRLEHALHDAPGAKDCEILFVTGAREARMALAHASIDIVVADYWLPDASGTRILHAARLWNHEVQRVLVASGPHTSHALDHAFDGEADTVWDKDWRPRELQRHLEQLLPARSPQTF